MKNQKFGVISTTLSAWIVPLTLVVHSLTEWRLKAINSRSLDITAKLSYQSTINLYAQVCFIAIVTLAVIFAFIGLKKDAHKAFAKLSFITIFGTLLLVAVYTATSYRIDSTEKRATQQRIESFWQTLSK